MSIVVSKPDGEGGIICGCLDRCPNATWQLTATEIQFCLCLHNGDGSTSDVLWSDLFSVDGVFSFFLSDTGIDYRLWQSNAINVGYTKCDLTGGNFGIAIWFIECVNGVLSAYCIVVPAGGGPVSDDRFASFFTAQNVTIGGLASNSQACDSVGATFLGKALFGSAIGGNIMLENLAP